MAESLDTLVADADRSTAADELRLHYDSRFGSYRAASHPRASGSATAAGARWHSSTR